VQVVPLVREQGFLGGTLAVTGLSGIPIAGLGVTAFFTSPALFLVGFGLPTIVGRRLEVGREPEGDAPQVPPLALVEEPWRTALRMIPTLVLAGALVVGSAQLAGALAAPLGGLISGLGVFELSLIPAVSRWERRHDMPLYAAADWFLLARGSGVYQPRPR
jgi:hypothetical protein